MKFFPIYIQTILFALEICSKYQEESIEMHLLIGILHRPIFVFLLSMTSDLIAPCIC